MPLAASRDLPSLAVLGRDGIQVVDASYDGPRLNIGVLNLMPDSILEATERQWMRLCGCFDGAATVILPFTFCADERSDTAQQHIKRYYETFEAVREIGLDLLIVTGANPKTADITNETYWDDTIGTVQWAHQQKVPIVCSCLATHAVVREFYGVERIKLPRKCWGVYEHNVVNADHPLIRNIVTDWVGPHSHFYGVTRQQLEAAGLEVLVDSAEAGAYLAISRDYPEFVFLQGHPEYDAIGLLKEYKRELVRFTEGEIDEIPPMPVNYFDDDAVHLIEQFLASLRRSSSRGDLVASFPEQELSASLSAPWRTDGQRLLENLLAEVLRAR